MESTTSAVPDASEAPAPPVDTRPIEPVGPIAPFAEPDDAQFVTQLPEYEGPLDVLLRLIEERELDITRVSLAAVANQFIVYISQLDRRQPQVISNFLQIAAKLILIKSRALLPQDETDDLIAALKAYQHYKRAAKILQARETSHLRSYRTEPPHIARPKSTALPLDNVTLDALSRAMQRVVDRWLPPPDIGNVMTRLPFTVNDCMRRIRSSVKEKPRVEFTEMMVGINTRVEIVITLLALLELLKRFAVRAYQDVPFGPIWFEHFPEDERPWSEMAAPADDDSVEFRV
jgi:segregation and condensation protein A